MSKNLLSTNEVAKTRKVLTKKRKLIIEKAVRKTVQEYGETLKLLGKE